MVMPLALLNNGEKGEVIDIRTNGKSTRLEDIGLRVGKEIEVIKKGKPGPLLVKIDETRLALGHGVAMKIMVKGNWS